MAPSRIVFLMYHELELPGRKPVQSEPGYVRYILPIDTFRSQMQWLKSSGFSGLSVSEAVRYPQEASVCITFDDGCETDLIAAAPVLREFGFRATFYLTAGFLGTPGYQGGDQVRELDALGFEIGCHSMTHPYLSDLSDAELGREIVDALHQPIRTGPGSDASRLAPGRIRRDLPGPWIVEKAVGGSHPAQRATRAGEPGLRQTTRRSSPRAPALISSRLRSCRRCLPSL